jgi:hypothetical protein
MKSCKGNVSYISEVFARQQLAAGPKSSIILEWSNVGSGSNFARTRCELVPRDQLSCCDVALAENHGKNDTDVVEDELAGKEHIVDRQSNDASVCPDLAAGVGFAAETDPEIITVVGELIVETAKALVNSKRKFTPPAPFEFSSSASNKRIRKG